MKNAYQRTFPMVYYCLQPFPPAAVNPGALAGWMANAAASSSVQSPVVAASSLPIPPNQGRDFFLSRWVLRL